MVGIVRGFTTAPELKGSLARAEEKEALKGQPVERRPVFFDIWGKYMVCSSTGVFNVGLLNFQLPLKFTRPNRWGLELKLVRCKLWWHLGLEMQFVSHVNLCLNWVGGAVIHLVGELMTQ